MIFQEQITPLVLTFNEAPNIRRVLEKLTWAKTIIVVDSFSTDETLEIVKSFPQVRVIQRRFDSFASQCNFGLLQIQSGWVLSLDADYILSDGLNSELSELKPSSDVAGYRVSFTYCVRGHPLRASLYPPRTVLYRKSLANYYDEGHGHCVRIDGKIIPLKHSILHDDRKPLERWFNEQIKYTLQEVKYLLKRSNREGGAENNEFKAADRIRQKIIFAPALVFFYTLLGKGLILDGWPGWYYVFQRTLAEILLSLKLLEARFLQKREDGA
jgi:glycosyltransferase involved in cell wall biosynthesis